MVKVYEKIRLLKDTASVEVVALFDTGSGGSYISDEVGEKIRYEPYPRPRKVPLAVKGSYAELVGYTSPIELEIAGYVLPEKEILGVIRKLASNAIIGRNLIEKYDILLEKEKIRFKEYPPRACLF